MVRLTFGITRKWIFILLLSVALAVTLFATVQAAKSPAVVNSQQPALAKGKVIIYLFWGDGCPHCAAEKPFLDKMAKQHPEIEIRAYEVWHVEENQASFKKMCKAFGFEAQGVPTTFLGKRYWIGFSDKIQSQMETAITACLTSNCGDAGAGIIPAPKKYPTKPATAEPTRPSIEPAKTAQPAKPANPSSNQLNFPTVGPLSSDSPSQFIRELWTSLINRFTPCSVWPISMLSGCGK